MKKLSIREKVLVVIIIVLGLMVLVPKYQAAVARGEARSSYCKEKGGKIMQDDNCYRWVGPADMRQIEYPEELK